MLEVLAWMVVPAVAESPLRAEPRESETSASAVFVRAAIRATPLSSLYPLEEDHQVANSSFLL